MREVELYTPLYIMKINHLQLPEHFCAMPFTYIYAEHQGSWKPCCKVDAYPQKKISFDEWWYEDQDLIDLRDAMLNHEVTPIIEQTCSACRIPESKGIKSYRQYALDKFNDFTIAHALATLIDSYRKTKSPILKQNQRLFILKVRGLGNHCNLKCYMCFPGNSTSRMNEMKDASEESINIFYKSNGSRNMEIQRKLMLDVDAEKSKVYEAIESISSNISDVQFAGGEPLMIEPYYDLMDKLIKSNDAKYINLSLSSNITRLGIKNRNILDYIDKFNQFNIQASIDDIFERDDWIRYPSSFNNVIENYKKLNNYDNVNMSVNITWSILNIANAENILSFYEENNMKVISNLNFVNSPIELNVKNYPFKKDLIKRYSESNNKILNDLAKALELEFSQEEFDKGIRYIKELDKIRRTKSYEVFPELTQFLT